MRDDEIAEYRQMSGFVAGVSDIRCPKLDGLCRRGGTDVVQSDQGDASFGRVQNSTEPDVRNSREVSDIAAVYSARLQQAIGTRSVAEFGRLCELSHSTLLNYLKGTLPGWENALKIARAAGRPLDWFAEHPSGLGDATGFAAADHLRAIEERAVYGVQREFALVPLYDVRAAAGHGAWNDQERITKTLAFRRDWLASNIHVSPEHLALIYVDGDSMSPRLQDGDVVMVDTSVHQVRADGMYVFLLDGALMIKSLQRLPGDRLRAFSENPSFQAFELRADDLHGSELSANYIVGRVVWGGIRL